MIAVVADTSPLNYFIQIECHEVLRILYHRILVPDMVAKELDQRGTPEVVRAWMQQVPPWVEVRKIVGADLLLMDERAGVRIARGRGMLVTGRLGVLTLAAQRSLLDIDQAITLLEATDFRCKPELFDQGKQAGRKRSGNPRGDRAPRDYATDLILFRCEVNRPQATGLPAAFANLAVSMAHSPVCLPPYAEPVSATITRICESGI